MSRPSHARLSTLSLLEHLSLTLGFPEHEGVSPTGCPVWGAPSGVPAPGGLLGHLGPGAGGQAGGPQETPPRYWRRKGTRALALRAEQFACLARAGRQGCSVETLAPWAAQEEDFEGTVWVPRSVLLARKLQGGLVQNWPSNTNPASTSTEASVGFVPQFSHLINGANWALLSFPRPLCGGRMDRQPLPMVDTRRRAVGPS